MFGQIVGNLDPWHLVCKMDMKLWSGILGMIKGCRVEVDFAWIFVGLIGNGRPAVLTKQAANTW